MIEALITPCNVSTAADSSQHEHSNDSQVVQCSALGPHLSSALLSGLILQRPHTVLFPPSTPLPHHPCESTASFSMVLDVFSDPVTIQNTPSLRKSLHQSVVSGMHRSIFRSMYDCRMQNQLHPYISTRNCSGLNTRKHPTRQAAANPTEYTEHRYEGMCGNALVQALTVGCREILRMQPGYIQAGKPTLLAKPSEDMRILGRMRTSKPHMENSRLGLSLLYTDTKELSQSIVVTLLGSRFLRSQKTARPKFTCAQ